jgi:hypothetical protein
MSHIYFDIGRMSGLIMGERTVVNSSNIASSSVIAYPVYTRRIIRKDELLKPLKIRYSVYIN